MNGAGQQAGPAAWQAHVKAPLPAVHASHLRACLGPLAPAGDAVLARMLATPRVAAAWTDALISHYGLAPMSGWQPDPRDVGAVALPAAQWPAYARACGLLWWADALSRELRAPVLRAVQAACGERCWDWVRAGRRIESGEPAAPSPAWEAGEPAAIRSAIDDMGWQCLLAWRQALDEPLRGWVALKWPVGAAPAAPDLPGAARAAGLVRQAAAMLAGKEMELP